jgi:hypothetical protein
MACPQCRHDCPGDTRFCPNCGAPQAGDAPAGYAPAGGAEPRAAIYAFASAALFLYYGFMLAPKGVSDSQVYNISVLAFVWTARIIGVGMLLVGLMSLARVRSAAMIELVLAWLATIACLGAGAIWVAHGDVATGILPLVFGIVNGMAASDALRRVRYQRRT